VARWLDGLPEEAIAADPPVAFVAAWVGGLNGASRQETERRLTVVEDPAWQGALPDGISSPAFGAALTRACVLFDDVGRALQAARRALQLAGPEPSPFHWMAQAALGHALYLSGRPAEARAPLEELTGRVSAAEQPYAVLTGLAVLSLLAGDEGDDHTAASLADRAMAIADAQGLGAEPLSGTVHLAAGRALTRRGDLAKAQEQLEWALELFAIEGMAVLRAHALLLLVAARHGHGDLPGARALLQQAHELVERLADPGMLPGQLRRSGRMLDSGPGRRARMGVPSPSGSWRSCGCCPAGCRPARSVVSSTSRSTPSGARSRPSTASSRSPAGPRRSPRRAGSAWCPGRTPRERRFHLGERDGWMTTSRPPRKHHGGR
jgi:ATP/maltotriose-dependent transcriptional regulator MalT